MIMAYLSLGSNLGDRRHNIRTAIIRLKESGVFIKRISSLYKTRPVGLVDQPFFYNAVMAANLRLSARQLLKLIGEIEQSLGRQRIIHWGPRTIDIDILLYGEETVQDSDLKIPHPRLGERAFVLIPLLEIAPDLVLPGGQKVTKLLAATDCSGVKKLSSDWFSG
ncbi:MAG TPA: 2-amino-4-hydroxy-6-hydroxymethyldihydropteridine diphosphokinase [bacterium]|nr:2-amino-4-hydroxy-6-hydroxymethyldihydropteridine diphosphokinase [bacterium]